jgi:hypothetical protein
LRCDKIGPLTGRNHARSEKRFNAFPGGGFPARAGHAGKTFPLPVNEQTRLEFRGEFFNAFNHTQFGLPNADSGAGPNFGRVSSAHTPRLIQLGAKVIF